MILASPYTQLFWNEYQINPDRCDYNIVFDNTISGILDINKLSSCLSRMVNDYLLLNSHLCFDQGNLYWKKNNVIIPLTCIDNNPKTIAEFISKPFYLDKGPLYRFGIVSLDKDRHRFIVVLHHALIDGNHFDEFLTLLSAYYNNPSLSKQENKQALSALHQKQHDEVNYLRKVGGATVWSYYLLGAEAKNNLPYIKSQYSGMGIIEFSIPAKTINTLKAAFSTSPFNLLLLAWGILIGKCCSTNTSYISYPIKITTSCNNLFGAQININIAKIAFQGADSFNEVVAYYQQPLQLLIAPDHKHTYLPIGDIFNGTDIQKLNVGFAKTHLRKSTFTFKDCHAVALEDNYVDMGGYDIVLEYQIIADNYCFRLKYNKGLFSIKQMTALTKHYHQLLQTFINTPEKPISKISLLTSSEYHKIVYDWNKTDKPYPKEKTVYQLFEEQVAKTPDNIAVVFDNNKLTYAQLNARANQLAHYLRQQVEIKPDMLIGLFLDKRLEMIVGILGILKAGGAYVPLDPSYPEARVRYILEDAQTPAILTQSHYLQHLSTLTQCLCIAMDSGRYLKESQENLIPLSQPSDLGYVIYTSGTTGNPKGVICSHSGINNLIQVHQKTFCFNEETNILQFASISFDASVIEIFSPLACGGRLNIISDQAKKDSDDLIHNILNKKINVAILPPVVLDLIPQKQLYFMKSLIVGGGVCSNQTISKFIKHVNFVNAYGPTEITVCATMNHYKTDDYGNNIGKPIHNTKCYVLDHHNQPVPIGVIGELHIAGAGLARGYLNQPKLTATKFIPNPFATDSDIAKGYTRLYKTGDLVRWLPEGNLEYIGRNDFQVKIRGYRIELGEIEATLLNFKEIQQAIVIAHSSSKETPEDKYLVGYVTTSNNKQINPDAVLQSLSQKLPEYMMPTAVIQLETLPLTINGKIDRKALPLPQLTQKHYVAPSNAEESLIYQAFAEILQIDKVSVTDDFFKLGGNSITAIRLSVLLQQNFDIHLSEIFELRTPQNIAKDRTITPGALKNKLLNLKKQGQETLPLEPETEAKIKQYQQSVKQLRPQKFTTKPINNVLLTGGTGFLGCNLLNQLLQLTHYTIYVFIRAKDKPAVIKRMEHKFQFYFEQSLQETYPSRVVFIPCDLEEPCLGLSSNQYEALASEIDTVIHAAALTKHYGDAETLRSANIDATINLLKFTQLTRLKDFHYISTHSVSEVMRQDGSKSYVFTENDHPEPSGTWSTIYNQTKYLGEQHTRAYRSKGIQTNIYRIGNLAYMQNGKPQENYHDNAFITYLEFLKQLGCIAHGMDTAEISHADKTAEAIVRLFDKRELSNGTYHVFDPHPTDLYNLLTDKVEPLSQVTFNEFIDKVVDYIERCEARDLFGRFLLNLGLDVERRCCRVSFKTLNSKTEYILKYLNFRWN